VWLVEGAEGQQVMAKVMGDAEAEGRMVFRTTGRVHGLQGVADRRGDALVAWLHEQPGHCRVMVHGFDTRRKAWDKTPTILGTTADLSAAPCLAANDREHAMVLWAEGPGGPGDGLVASHYWPSDHIWSDRPVPVVSHAVRHHQVAMDDNGNALAIWVHAPYGQRSALEGSFYDVHRSEWTAPWILANGSAITSPRLVMNEAGEALAAWCQQVGQGASRLFAKAFRKGAWEAAAECLDPGYEPIQDFALALGPDGRAGVLIVVRGAKGDRVCIRIHEAAWTAPKVLGTAVNSVCTSPRVALCPQGLSALWLQGTGPQQALVQLDA
jgi:hypothetical protein